MRTTLKKRNIVYHKTYVKLIFYMSITYFNQYQYLPTKRQWSFKLSYISFQHKVLISQAAHAGYEHFNTNQETVFVWKGPAQAYAGSDLPRHFQWRRFADTFVRDAVFTIPPYNKLASDTLLLFFCFFLSSSFVLSCLKSFCSQVFLGCFQSLGA